MCLTTGQRDQTIKCLNLDYIKISSDKVVLLVPQTLKTTRPGHHVPPIELKTFKDSELCVIANLQQYIKMTAPFRNTDTKQLLLSFVQPHKPISTTTLSRWCLTVMKQSGINVNIFGSHSTRSASTSKCKIRGYHSKKSQSQRDGRMKKHLHNFMIRQFKRTFQTIYLDEICCFLYLYVYIVLFIQETYGVNYSRNNTNQIEKNPGLLIISSLILSNPHLYERSGN